MSWSAVTGASKYKLERGHSDLGVSTTVEWPDPTNTDHGDRIITDMFVTNNGIVSRTIALVGFSRPCGPDNVYSFRVSAYGNGDDYLEEYGPTEEAIFGALTASRGTETGRSTARSPTQSPLCTPQLSAPVEFGVVPLPQHGRGLKPETGQRWARLRWTGVVGADSYVVEARKKVSGSGWEEVRSESLETGFTFSLDKILDDDEGLDDFPAYEFKVKSLDSTGAYAESDFSDEITIVDSPIRSVNGDSRNAGRFGRMVVKWHSAGSSNVRYTVRWRRISDSQSNPHSSEDWHPTPADSEDDWSSATTRELSHEINESNETLKFGEIYAVQLNYTIGADQYFSARETYVWISARAAGHIGESQENERIGNMPLGRRLEDFLAPNLRTYVYRICEDTFVTIDPNFSTSDWASTIEVALEQWELASDGLVVMTLDAYTAEEVASNPDLDAAKVGKSKPCADYTHTIKDIKEGVNAELMSVGGPTATTEMIERIISNLHYYADILKEDRMYNEIIMYDDRPEDGDVVYLSELAGYIGFALCGETGAACTYPELVSPDPDGEKPSPLASALNYIRRILGLFDAENYHTRDILMKQVAFENASLSRPNVQFNTCNTEDNWAFFATLHEGGHVLGIAHPKLGESVMNFNEETYRIEPVEDPATYSHLAGEPDCFPHPLDILAIYALYQTLD